MKRFRFVATALVLAFALLSPGFASSLAPSLAPSFAPRGRRPAPATPATLARLEGRGLLQTLACGACVLGAEVVYVTGASQVSVAATAFGPTLIAKCAGVCALAEE